MKWIINTFTIMITIILISCSNDNDLLSEDVTRISISATCSSAEISSRTSTTGYKTTFTNGDNIGVFETLTNRNNVSFSYNGTSWATPTPLYWYNGTSTHTFYAYYPYNSSSQGLSVAIPALSQQKVSTKPDPSCDMLVTPTAKTQTRSNGTSVSLTMNHAFAILRFDIKMSLLNLINPYNLDSLVIRGGNSTGGTYPYGMFNTTNTINSINYNLTSNSILVPVNNSTTCSQYLRSAPVSVNILLTSVSVYAFILPGRYTNPTPAVNLKLSALGIIPNNTGFLTLPNASSFTAGNMYIYQISIGLNILGKAKTTIQDKGNFPVFTTEIIESPP